MTAGFDLLGVGHPSVDLMFSGIETWPELGRDIDAGGLGVSAGTSFNTPAAANRLGLRVGFISIIGSDVWSRLTREEYETQFSDVFDQIVAYAAGRPINVINPQVLDHARGGSV